MLARWSLKRKASAPSQVSLKLRVHGESSSKVKTKPCDRPPLAHATGFRSVWIKTQKQTVNMKLAWSNYCFKWLKSKVWSHTHKTGVKPMHEYARKSGMCDYDQQIAPNNCCMCECEETCGLLICQRVI